MRLSIIYSILFLLCLCPYIGAKDSVGNVTGLVICDGRALENVVVTDGFICTKTDSKGKYSIPHNSEARFVYISTPSGYVTDVKDNTSVPLFYKEIQAGEKSYNFFLKKNRKNDLNHLFIAQADVQMATNDDLDLYKQLLPDCVSFIQAQSDVDVFGINCGDIVGDNLNLLADYLQASSVLNIPVYHTIGNHDMDYNGRSHETSTRTYEKHFGPTYYSFNKGKTHYIVINNTFFIGRQYFYMGYVDEKTFRWLEQDLSYIEPGSPVFLVQHIPSQLDEVSGAFDYNVDKIASQTINAKALHQLLEPFDTNIISGHMHYNDNIAYNDKLYEHITGAVCGTWWQGDVCLDGTPQGFGVYEVKGDEVKWYYKSFNHPKEYQFRAYPQGTYPDMPDDIVVNVWNWDKAWKVEWYENGIARGEMTHFTGYDADALALCARKDLKYNWISPIETDHLFRARSQLTNSNIKIKVTDHFGNIFEKEISK